MLLVVLSDRCSKSGRNFLDASSTRRDRLEDRVVPKTTASNSNVVLVSPIQHILNRSWEWYAYHRSSSSVYGYITYWRCGCRSVLPKDFFDIELDQFSDRALYLRSTSVAKT
jgi:hypothetical protein